MPFEDSGSQEHDVDAIIASAYGESNPGISESAPPSAPPPEPVRSSKEYEFNYKGQPVKITDDDPRHNRWLSQGYDYSQRAEELNKQQETWNQSKQEWEKSWGVYKEIDEFAKQNPDWWTSINQGYEQKKSNPLGIPDEIKQYLDQRFEPLAQDLPLMKEFLQDMQRQKIEALHKEEDTKLEQAVKEVQTKYPDLDFASKDESGQSLEQRVIGHATQHGFPTFRSAFLDYYHDNLEKMAEARGKETVAQDMAKRKKLGFLDDSPAPTSSTKPSFGREPRARSWNDPMLNSEQILKDFKFA